jgi:hypothetical protein
MQANKPGLLLYFVIFACSFRDVFSDFENIEIQYVLITKKNIFSDPVIAGKII